MESILLFVVFAFAIQVLIFIFVRKKKKQEESGVVAKYNIRSAADAFRLINDPHVPEEDRLEIEKFYKGE